MDEQKIAELLDQFEDEDLEILIEFVERTGSIEDAQAVIDALDELRKAA